MSVYREHRPGAALAPLIECCWEGYATAGGEINRILPDGCADFIYTRENGRSRLDVVGTMTTWRDHPLPPGARLLGVRFRAGAMAAAIAAPAPELRDQSIDLASLTGREAGWLRRALDDDPSPSRWIELLKPLAGREADPVQRALACLEDAKGQVNLAWLAAQANLGERQFRRLCIARTGLPPKQIARILRFREAARLALRAGRGGLTGIAYRCGYSDQAHFNHEFRAWSGMTPGEYVARHRARRQANLP